MSAPPARRRWVGWALAAYVAVVAALLLSPLSPGRPMDAATAAVRTVLPFVRTGWIEFGTNIVLFIPVGFLLTLLFRRAWPGVVLALVLSASAEIVQLLLPARVASLRDIVANVLGALVGAAIAWAVFIRRRRARPTATIRAR